MKVKKVSPGARVELKTRKGNFKCWVLESPRSDVILVKLDSGYNIGIKEEDILDLKILKEKKVEKEFVEENKFDKNKPNVALVVTGGTISSRLDYKTGGVKWITEPKELLKFYPEITEIANISKIEVPFMKASEDMDSKDWSEIAKKVLELLNDKNISGVIVTHGTDFLHYSAAALSFAFQNLNKPVVLTYSQRSSDRASSDARLNLQCAARAAVSDIAEVMLVGHSSVNDNFCFALPGTKCRKMHTSRRDTFRPINSLPVAKVFPDNVQPIKEYNIRDNSRKVILKNKFSDKVALLKFYPGMDPGIFDYILEKGFKGVVVEVSGLGHLATSDARKNILAKIKKLVSAGVVVCGVAQTIYGKLNPRVYSNGRDLEKTGMIFLEDMLSETAFVKLSWVLGDAKMKKTPKEFMLKNFAREFNSALGEEEFLN